MGKNKRLSFNVGKHNSDAVLRYVHADLWGSPNVHLSLSRNQYFLSIIDDYTRKVWVYFLATKDEAFSKFREWKGLVENQVNKNVKCLRTDNGLEFCNVAFDNFCKQQTLRDTGPAHSTAKWSRKTYEQNDHGEGEVSTQRVRT